MIVIAGCIVIKDNKVLMVKEGKKICYEKWNNPMGKVKDSESIIEAAIRETYEETGCKVKLTSVLPIYQKNIPQIPEPLLLIRFKAEIIEENLKIQNPKEILDVQWLDIEKVKSMSIEDFRGPDVVQAIKDCEENKTYPLSIFNENNIIEGKK